MHATRILCGLAAAAVLGGAVGASPVTEPPSTAHEHGRVRHSIGWHPGLVAADQAAEWSQQPAGPRGVAHRAGGIRVASITALPRPEVHMVGVTAAEPTLGVDSDGNVFFVGLEDTGTVLQAPVMRSADDGKTFTEVSPRVGPARVQFNSQDPLLYLDQGTDRVFTADLSLIAGCSTTISYTDDQGETWSTTQLCLANTDHQNMFTGPPVTSTTTGYPNVVYYCAIDGGALGGFGTITSCGKSIDGGRTWVRTGEPPFTDDPTHTDPGHFGVPGHCGGETGHGFADAKGTIYVPRGYCGQPWLAISDDEGLTWRRVQVADNGMPQQEGGLGLQDHEAGVAVDRDGTIYYLWTARDRLPYLAVSRDAGETWSKPMMIAPPGVTEAWGPAIEVGGNGKIAATYVASKDAPGGEAPTGTGDEYEEATWHPFITVTDRASARNPIFYSAQLTASQDPVVIGPCPVFRCAQQFDFIDVVIGPDGTPWSSFVDGCSPPPEPKCGNLFGMGAVGRMVGGPKLR